MHKDMAKCYFERQELKDVILREFAESDPVQEHSYECYDSDYICPHCSLGNPTFPTSCKQCDWVELEGVYSTCPKCRGDVTVTRRHKHADTCLWLRARKLMGMV